MLIRYLNKWAATSVRVIIGTDHQTGASFDHLERAIGVVVDPGVSL
jgi:hypothetical protein